MTFIYMKPLISFDAFLLVLPSLYIQYRTMDQSNVVTWKPLLSEICLSVNPHFFIISSKFSVFYCFLCWHTDTRPISPIPTAHRPDNPRPTSRKLTSCLTSQEQHATIGGVNINNGPAGLSRAENTIGRWQISSYFLSSSLFRIWLRASFWTMERYLVIII